jgi:hypothetical protein
MAVLGSLASGAEDPPPFSTIEVRGAGPNFKMIGLLKFFDVSEDVEKEILFRVKRREDFRSQMDNPSKS